MESAQEKFSHIYEENSMFGFREGSAERNDFATSKDKQTEVIQIDTSVYRNIITQTQLALSVEKIEFLQRFVPNLRDDDKIGSEALKELEVHFQKEEYTRGYHVLR